MAATTNTVNVEQRIEEVTLGAHLTGASMVAAPILLMAGAALLIGIYEGSPAERLAAFADNEARATVALNIAIAGVVLTVFAVAGIAAAVTPTHPHLGRTGGALATIGLFGPAFFLGIDYLGIELAGMADRAAAATALENGETTPNIVNLAGPALVFGFILLAIGTARAGVLPRSRSWALGLTALAPVGLISGIVVISVVAWIAFGIAVIPMGIRLLRVRPADTRA